jgi:hypothetical protein
MKEYTPLTLSIRPLRNCLYPITPPRVEFVCGRNRNLLSTTVLHGRLLSRVSASRCRALECGPPLTVTELYLLISWTSIQNIMTSAIMTLLL